MDGVSALRTGLCQVRYSLIPDGTGKLPAFSIPVALDPALLSRPARFACVQPSDFGGGLAIVFPDLITNSPTVARGRGPSRRTRPCPRQYASHKPQASQVLRSVAKSL